MAISVCCPSFIHIVNSNHDQANYSCFNLYNSAEDVVAPPPIWSWSLTMAEFDQYSSWSCNIISSMHLKVLAWFYSSFSYCTAGWCTILPAILAISHRYELFLLIWYFGFEDAIYCILLKEIEVGAEGENHWTIQSKQQEERRLTVNNVQVDG